MAKLISKTYGDALVELAEEENKTDQFVEEVEEIREVLKENPDFYKLMTHPRISKEHKEQVITTAFSGRISKELTGFLILLVQKGRYAKLEEILTYFLEQVKERKGIGVVTVTTPMQLLDTQKEELKEKLLQTTGYRELEFHYVLDQSLIGGMQIRMKDRVVDSSIRTKIEKMHQELRKVQLS